MGGFGSSLGLGKFQDARKRLKRFINLESNEISRKANKVTRPIKGVGKDVIKELGKSPSETFGVDLSPLSKGQAKSIREPYMQGLGGVARASVATPFAPQVSEALYGRGSPQATAPLWQLPITPVIPESVVRRTGVGNIPYVGDEVAAMGAGLTTPASVGTMGLGLGAAAPGTMAARLPFASRFIAQGPRSMAGEIAGATALGAASRPIEQQTGTFDTPVGGIGPHVLGQFAGGGLGAGLAGRSMIPDADAPFIKKRAAPGTFEVGDEGIRYPTGTEIRGRSQQVYKAGDVEVHVKTNPETREFGIDLTEGKGNPIDAAKVWNYVYDLAALNEDWNISAHTANQNLFSHMDRLQLPRNPDSTIPNDFLFKKADMDNAVDKFKSGQLGPRARSPAYNIAATRYLDQIPGADGLTPINRSRALMTIERYLSGSTAIDREGVKERILHMLGDEYADFYEMPEFDDIFTRMEEARIRNAGRQGSLPTDRVPDITDEDVAAGMGQVGQGQQNLLDSITDVDNTTPDVRNLDLTPEQQRGVDVTAFGEENVPVPESDLLPQIEDWHRQVWRDDNGPSWNYSHYDDNQVIQNVIERRNELLASGSSMPPTVKQHAQETLRNFILEAEKRGLDVDTSFSAPKTTPGTDFSNMEDDVLRQARDDYENMWRTSSDEAEGTVGTPEGDAAAKVANYYRNLVDTADFELRSRAQGGTRRDLNAAVDKSVEMERAPLKNLSDDELLRREQIIREEARASGPSVNKSGIKDELVGIMREIRDRGLYSKRITPDDTSISPPDDVGDVRMAADDMGNVTDNAGGEIQPDDLGAIPPDIERELPSSNAVDIVRMKKGSKGRAAVYRVVETIGSLTSADRAKGVQPDGFTRAIITGKRKGRYGEKGAQWTVHEVDGAGNPIDATGRTFNTLNQAKDYAFEHYTKFASAQPGATPSGAGLSGAQQKLLKELGYDNSTIDEIQAGMGGPPINRPPTKLGGPDEPLPERPQGEQLQMFGQRADTTKKGPELMQQAATPAEIREEIGNLRRQYQESGKATMVNPETGEIIDMDKWLGDLEKRALKELNNRGKKEIRNPEGFMRHLTGPNVKRSRDFVLNVLNLPKGALTNFVELSVMFAQNFLQTVSHPVMSAANMKKFWIAATSDQGYKDINNKMLSQADDIVRENPNAQKAITKLRSGLIINPENAPINELEDIMGSNFWFRAPGIRRWSRATQTFLNAQRIDKFGKLLKMVPEDQLQNPKYLEDLASYTLAATGRGDIPQMIAKNAALVRLVFAPRLWAGHFQFLGSPALYNNSVIRKDFARTAAAVAGFGASMMGLMELAGADINTDPRSSDWGKGKFGNMRVDFWGGYQQDARFLYNLGQAAEKFAKGEKPTVTVVPESGIPYETGIDDYIEQYVRTKLDPVGEGVATQLTGRTVTGRAKPGARQLMYNSFTPLILQDIVESYKNEGLLAAAGTAPLSYMGVRVNTYKPNKFAQAITKYEEMTGKDYNPETDFVKLQTNPETQPLMEASLKERADANQQFAKEIIQQDKNFELKEQELRLPEMANEILSGNTQMAPRFAETYQDYQDHISAVLGHKTIANEETKNSPTGKALQAFLDIGKTDDKYWNPETGDIDIELYIQDKNAAFEKVRAADPDLARAIESRLKTHDPAAQKVEKEYKQADKLYREYLQMPKWNETVANQNTIKDIQRLASRLGYMLAEEGHTNVPPMMLYNMLKEENPEIDGAIFMEAFRLRSGTGYNKFHLNKVRDDFLIKNKALLYKYFPDIYNKAVLGKAARAEGGQTQVGYAVGIPGSASPSMPDAAFRVR